VTDSPADRLRTLFAAAADPVQAESMARYLKGRFPFHGIPAGPRRELQRQAFAGRRLDRVEAEAEAAALADELWALPQREYQYAACDVLRAVASHASAGLLPLIERLAVTRPWWDTVDSLAHVAGTLVLAHPELGKRMQQLSRSSDPWLVRIALLHQLDAYGRTDVDRLLRTCAAHAGSPDFFVRKAIGWALRQYARTDPAVVRAFVEAHPELSPLSRREALKGL
jgi:3-methyladenine DNA glycosylase AlkD